MKDETSDRKLRLFAVACCRSIWHLLPNEPARAVVCVVERFADGLATEGELGLAEEAFTFAEVEPGYSHAPDVAAVAHGAIEQLARESDLTFAQRTGRVAPNWPEQAYEAAAGSVRGVTYATTGSERTEKVAELTARLRCVFGNPFRPVTVEPVWLTSDVHILAEGIYQKRAFDRMPILADALQDAGCNREDILDHCRGPGPHVRGCWVVDLVLGKE